MKDTRIEMPRTEELKSRSQPARKIEMCPRDSHRGLEREFGNLTRRWEEVRKIVVVSRFHFIYSMQYPDTHKV